MGRKCWTQHSNSRARSTLLSEKHRKFNTERPPGEENENPSIKTRFFPPSGAETSKAVSQIVLGEGTKQSSDHVERADAEQEGAAPGGTRDDVMSQVSGGRGGGMLGSGGRGVCVCVCVCLAWSRSRDISLWGERTKRGEGIFKFKIKDTSVREEKSPEPPSNISGNSVRVSGPNKQRSRCGHFWTHTSMRCPKWGITVSPTQKVV